MSTKNRVLEELEKNRERDISGEELADSLHITRSAIWKAINELRLDGYEIDASTNKGYRMTKESDRLSPEGIKIFMEGVQKPDIFVYSSLPSTNQKAKELALNGAKDGSVVVANEQTAGRGRLGRTFYSPADSGIYMSLILRPKLNLQQGTLITTYAALIVCLALEEVLKISPTIKWVNDVVWKGKKVCGILTEAVTDFESGNLEFVIVGIGINFSTVYFPEEAGSNAGSLEVDKDSGIIRNKLIAKIADKFQQNKDKISGAVFMEEYKRRSAVIGTEIEIIYGEEREKCVAIDITEEGGLLVELPDGSRKTLNSGEISVRGGFYHD